MAAAASNDNEFKIGDMVEINSDPEDDTECHVHRGQISRMKKGVICIREDSDDREHLYFQDEVQVKRIQAAIVSHIEDCGNSNGANNCGLSLQKQMQNMEIQMKDEPVEHVNFSILDTTKNQTATIRKFKSNQNKIQQVLYHL